MAEGETANRESVLSSIALVFSHSKLKEVVGSDALKSVLSGQYRDLVQGETLHLQVVWDLLADQPDFVEADALAPFSVLKTWESELGLTVEVPKSLANLGPTEILAQASHCPIPRAQKARALNPEGARAKARETLAAMDAGAPAKTKAKSTRNPAAEAALGVVAFLGLAYGGYSLYSSMQGPAFKSVAVADVQTSLPVAKAKRLGEELNLTITDASWFESPLETRKAALEATLDAMGAKKIKSIIVFDGSGQIRASAQWFGSPPTMNVRFQ